MTSDLIITGAREHNLKDISLTLPRDRFIVITGLSGSGKSSLAFDTIYAEAKTDADQIDGLRESQNRFAHLMTDLEREAFKLGYRYAAAFSGGECVLCDECVGQTSGEACRHPFEARPSMEAVGIDVVATAEAAGLSVELPAEEHPSWTGLLLID